MTQGKCTTCRVRWTWQGARSGNRGVFCPCCGAQLQPTTHLLRKWPTRLTTKYEIIGSWQRALRPKCTLACRASMTADGMAEIARLEGGWQPHFNPDTP